LNLFLDPDIKVTDLDPTSEKVPDPTAFGSEPAKLFKLSISMCFLEAGSLSFQPTFYIGTGIGIFINILIIKFHVRRLE
jgi:hypothetical protein